MFTSKKQKEIHVENLGHSTFLVKKGNLTILTDPCLTNSVAGIKRALPPPVQPEDISPDIVLISHAHYDHLDLKTLNRLKGNFTIVTPENCKKVLRGEKEVVELENFESTTVKNVRITKVPALHSRGRSLFYPDTGVGGFVFEIDGLNFYFAGDTAFSPSLYSFISGKFSRIDFAMLPIGGFMPFPFRKFHQTPEEAISGFRILKARFMIPIHFGTWHLIPFYLKRERALERLKVHTYIYSLQDAVKVVEPGCSIDFDF